MEVVGQLFPRLDIGCELPFREQGTCWDDGPNPIAAIVRLSIKIPNAIISEMIGVRIAHQNIGRNISRKIPRSLLLAAAAENQIDRRQVTGMISIARTDEHRDEISRVNGQIFERAGLHFLAALRCA